MAKMVGSNDDDDDDDADDDSVFVKLLKLPLKLSDELLSFLARGRGLLVDSGRRDV